MAASERFRKGLNEKLGGKLCAGEMNTVCSYLEKRLGPISDELTENDVMPYLKRLGYDSRGVWRVELFEDRYNALIVGVLKTFR